MLSAHVYFQAMRKRRFFRIRVRRRVLVVSLLFAYALANFAYFYQHFGGATSVSIRDGQFLALYKENVIAQISREDYLNFPNLLLRAITAAIGLTSFLGMSHS